jgi:hypothetical protein
MGSYYLTEPLPRDAERTPVDWRGLLLERLNEQARATHVYEAYYNGLHPLQFATSKFREAFGNLFSAFADNWCQIVVDAAVERLQVVGFQIGGSPSEEAWAIWQRNALDVESVIAHTEAGKCGHAYLLVDPNNGQPRITVEHPSQMIVASDPGDRRQRLAALKKWKGDDGYLYTTLYLPDTVLRFESQEPETHLTGEVEWVPRSGDGGPIADNSLGVVPVIPLENKPGLLGTWQPFPFQEERRLLCRGHSDLGPAIPLQNAVNKLCLDMIVASEYGAFPMRVITGVEIPKDTSGRPLITDEDLKASMSRWLVLEDPASTAISLPAADLNNFVVAVEMLIQHLAAQTRTPPHYLLAKLVNTSGDALSVAEAGLVSKCRAKALFFSDAWEEAMALALTAAGTETVSADCEAMWANPERVSQGVLVDAAVKKKTLGVPLPVIWLELGYTPEQVAQMETQEASAEEAQLEAAVTPPTPTGPGPVPAPPAPPPIGGTDG